MGLSLYQDIRTEYEGLFFDRESDMLLVNTSVQLALVCSLCIVDEDLLRTLKWLPYLPFALLLGCLTRKKDVPHVWGVPRWVTRTNVRCSSKP